MPTKSNRSGSAKKRVASKEASKIGPRIYLTCLATAKDATQLADLGITHVVSVIEGAPTFPSSYPLSTLHISISDTDDADILSHLPDTTSFIRGALAESPKNRILVHCFMGISRSATVVMAYLIATSKMTPKEALGTVQSKRRIVRPNPGFMSQLQEYYSKCSNSSQAGLGDEPPDKDGRPGNMMNTHRDRRHTALTAKTTVKSYGRHALAAVTSLPPRISYHSSEGREYWKYEERLF